MQVIVIIINVYMRLQRQDLILSDLFGCSYFSKFLLRSRITNEGEALEGNALDDVKVAGVVTSIINRASDAPNDDLPII